MLESFGFCDLCINVKNGDNSPNLNSFAVSALRNTLNRLHEVGYKTVAVNQTIDENIFDSESKKKKKGKNDKEKEKNDHGVKPTLSPLNLDELINEFNGKLNILQRLTFLFNDSSQIYSLNKLPAFKKFDLFSIIPKNQSALQFACAQLNTDIITIHNASNELRLSRKLYTQAIERGVHFEIQYANLIMDKHRKNALQVAHLFYVFGKSKNVIVSSGASNINLIRNPYDVINLGSILGLSEVKAKAAILSQCKHLILKAEGRRYGKAIFGIEVEDYDNGQVNGDIAESSSVKRLKVETNS